MRVVQFFALPTGPYQPPGEHQFEVLDDGRVLERYVYTNQPAGLWVEIPGPDRTQKSRTSRKNRRAKR